MEPNRNHPNRYHPDYYFIENLHLLFNAPNLLKKNYDGHPFSDAMTYKGWKGDLEKKEIETILERLKVLFHTYSNTMEGGGMNLTKLKRKIRERIRRIQPRDH
jgi:hypothetical protein